MSGFRVNAETATWRVVDEEAVIIQVQTSEYFSLNRSGTLVWSQLAERHHSPEQMAAWLGQRCGREPAAVAPDVSAFFEQLQAARLLVDGQGPQPLPDPPAAQSVLSYEAPQLVRFGDLETLILSGE